MTTTHIMEVLGTVIIGSLFGGVGAYIAASFKMGARLLVLEKSVSDYHLVTDRRLDAWDERMIRTEAKIVLTDVCDNCKEIWLIKIDAYHTEAQRAVSEAQKAIEEVKVATKHDMDVLNESNKTTVGLLEQIMKAVTDTNNKVERLKVVR